MSQILPHVSASQVSKFLRCNRLWSWEYIQGFRGPATPNMRRGTAIHHAMETYVNTGDILEEVFMNVDTGRPAKHGEKWLTGRFVRAAIPHIPDRATLTTEQRIVLTTLSGEGPSWVGYIDAHDGVSVYDYKTSSNIKAYAKTTDDLKTDPQAVSYAWAVFLADDEIETVTAHWVYLETRNKVKVNTKKVSVTFTRAECAKEWDKLMSAVGDMVESAAETDTLSLTPNTEACNDFGGCPHQHRCGTNLVLEGGKMTDLLAKLTESVEKPGATPSNPNPNPAPAQAVLPPDAAPRETTPEEQAAFDETKGKPKRVTKRKTPAKKKSPKTGGMTVYVNCCPVKGDKEYELFETWIQPVVDRLNEFVKSEFSIDEFRLLEYSKEKALFGKVLQEHLVENRPHALVVTMSSSFARDSLQILCVHADQVIRSMIG